MDLKGLQREVRSTEPQESSELPEKDSELRSLLQGEVLINYLNILSLD